MDIKVGADIHFPNRWNEYLKDSQNKSELFVFLATMLMNDDVITESKCLPTNQTVLKKLVYHCVQMR